MTEEVGSEGYSSEAGVNQSPFDFPFEQAIIASGLAIQLSSVKQAHKALLLSYVRVLRTMSTPGRYKQYLTRLLTELHIRSRVSTLARLYAFECEKAFAEERLEESAWYKEAAESCNRLVQNLSTWQRIKLLFTTVIPFILAIPGLGLLASIVPELVKNIDANSPIGWILVPIGWVLEPLKFFVGKIWELTTSLFAAAKAHPKRGELVLVLVYMWLLTSYIFYPLRVCVRAFILKRWQFFPGWVYFESSERKRLKLKSSYEKWFSHPAFNYNIYLFEENLFRLLHARKPKEIPIDAILNISMCLIAVGIYLSAWATLFSDAIISLQVAFGILSLLLTSRLITSMVTSIRAVKMRWSAWGAA